MKSQWMIWLLVTGLAYVSGNICDTDATAECFTKLTNYEGKDFPLYGQGEVGLEETCKDINASFTCLHTYFEKCNGTEECDEKCQSLIKETQSFSINTGLKNLAGELCDASSIIRQSYLTAYECLEKNVDAYAACHNQSEISLEYIFSIKDATVIPKRCCYFSWYHDCFSNITQEHCDKEATPYVQFGLFKLVGSLAEKLCGNSGIKCSSPPVHSDEVGHEDPIEEKKDEDKQTEKVKDINDSKKDKHETSSASIISCPVAGTVVVFYFILFMNLLLY